MFNRHQAEITVMQFRGHSLPVHQSVWHSGTFTLSHIISLNPPTWSLSITGHWNVSLPSGASPWNSISLGRVEGQNITQPLVEINSKKKKKGRQFLDSATIDTFQHYSGNSLKYGKYFCFPIYIYIYIYIGCLKIDAIHWYDNDLLRR